MTERIRLVKIPKTYAKYPLSKVKTQGPVALLKKRFFHTCFAAIFPKLLEELFFRVPDAYSGPC